MGKGLPAGLGTKNISVMPSGVLVPGSRLTNSPAAIRRCYSSLLFAVVGVFTNSNKEKNYA
jgi:hypothetical protein